MPDVKIEAARWGENGGVQSSGTFQNVKRSLSMNVSWKKWLLDDASWVMCLVFSGESKAILLLFQTGPHLPPIPGHLNHQQHTILSTVSCVWYKFRFTFFSKHYCRNQWPEKKILNERPFRKHPPWYLFVLLLSHVQANACLQCRACQRPLLIFDL